MDTDSASATGTPDTPRDEERSTFAPGIEEAGDQSTNASDLAQVFSQLEQKLSSDYDKIAEEFKEMTNGEEADNEDTLKSKPGLDKDGQMSTESATSKEQQASRLDTSETETDLDKPDSGSGEQKTDSDGKLAASVKEDDVSDECLTTAPAQEDEWMDILGNGQLKKKVVTAGTDSSRPMQSSLVKVKVTGHLDSGVCIQDSTEMFVLGDGDVIAAIDMSVALMNKGETAEVITTPRFAYGTKGRVPDIPGDSTLTFTLELLDVQPALDYSKLTAEERLQFGEKKRERGNELFGREDYSGAINSYSKAVKLLDSSAGGLSGDTSVLQKILDSRLKSYNNMAASQLKVGAIDAAIRSCEEVLLSQPENIKALYRLGKAYSSKGQTDKAIPLLKKAIKLDPESKLLHRELALLTHKHKKEVESEKTMYKRMMGSMADAAQNEKGGKSGTSVLKWSLLAGGTVAAVVSMGVAYYRATH